MSNVKNVIALTQETVANSTTGDVNTDDNTSFVDKSANRVGIGTTSPQNELDVRGDLRIQGTIPEVLFKSPDGSTNQYYIGANISDVVDGGIIIGEGSGVSGGTARVAIDASGNVGIGTTSGLSNTLNVEGTGRFTGNVTASYYHGNGSELTGISAGATGGGDDQVFFLSDINVNNDFTVPTGRNALSAGPTAVNTGITVTVPSGSTWTIV